MMVKYGFLKIIKSNLKYHLTLHLVFRKYQEKKKY